MVEVIRKSFLVGIGALALARDQVEQLISDSVARGEMSTEQGKSLVEEMTRRAEQERDRLETFVRTQVDRALDSAGVATRSDLARLEGRIAALEARLGSMGQSTAASSDTSSRAPGTSPISLEETDAPEPPIISG